MNLKLIIMKFIKGVIYQCHCKECIDKENVFMVMCTGKSKKKGCFKGVVVLGDNEVKTGHYSNWFKSVYKKYMKPYRFV